MVCQMFSFFGPFSYILETIRGKIIFSGNPDDLHIQSTELIAITLLSSTFNF
jgi:hypothetical protein